MAQDDLIRIPRPQGVSVSLKLPEIRSPEELAKSHSVAWGDLQARVTCDVDGELTLEILDAHYHPTADATSAERSRVQEMNQKLARSLR